MLVIVTVVSITFIVPAESEDPIVTDPTPCASSVPSQQSIEYVLPSGQRHPLLPPLGDVLDLVAFYFVS